MQSRQGRETTGFCLEVQRKTDCLDTDVPSISIVRSEADLAAFHRQLLSLQAVESEDNAKDIDTSLNFPGSSQRRSERLGRSFPLAGAIVVSVCALADAALLHRGDFDMLRGTKQAALVAALVLAQMFAAVLIDRWVRTPPCLDSSDCSAIESYLQRALALRGKQTQDAVQALLEPPLRPDWPGRMGPIDLVIHDLPHPRSQTEWWYFNAHLECQPREGGPRSAPPRKFSVFVCFFRFFKYYDRRSKTRYFSHALTWAVSDVENSKYYSDVLLERDAPRSILKALDQGHGVQDRILQRALREILEKDSVPLPDRLLSRDAVVETVEETGELRLNYEGASLEKSKDGVYRVRASHYKLPCALDLSFSPEKAPIRHGDHGVVKGREGDDMFYYCISRCKVEGSVSVPRPAERGAAVDVEAKDHLKVQKGSGWFDHEFGGAPEEERLGKDTDASSAKEGKSSQAGSSESSEDPSEPELEGKGCTERIGEHHTGRYAWNWLAAQLDDGTEVSAALLVNPVAGEVMEVKAIIVDAQGERTQFDGSHGVLFTADSAPDAVWTSVRTFVSYPVKYRLCVPGAGLDLAVEASFADQEFMTLIAKPAFWEGRCEVSGTRCGHAVRGTAFVERNGFSEGETVNRFFKNVGKKVRASVRAMYPLQPTFEEALELVATKDTPHHVRGVPLDVLGQTLIAPVRAVADRGGKSWRSYGALACVDCVGGDSRDFVDWVAMPEFLHVGSLIVDDIQDGSETRRGGPAAHMEYGVPLCINAGTAAYFQCEQMIRAPGLTPEELNRCYALYFSALRGGHAGQALDIHGLDYMMDAVVASGDAALLEERILGIHMLKTAVPAGTLARMGALVGKGSEEQVEAMGRYFESVGVAFQIMDDVLNLRGLFANETDKLKPGTSLKRLGEDIVDGKVTFPVAKAMGVLDSQEERRALWDSIRAKPQDQGKVDAIIAQLEALGAIEACVRQAENEVEQAWDKLDRVIPDSFPKMMLRAFGWFVIDRIC
ncbi:Geranylgeranyl pyrophosphate synthase [Hondaea fermentalgiana]|uniref:Geranylgeranyl pyrophosphate synthase n=1 Tax=Hondaea fermentalgiana TaxID=2315210 RepID=A0A2R5G6M1_9STRA|nr:Geranylgeranyl pyrophosphate synthase [Hondaea fermentalgiana]|eukprot:GBG25438.1 Geranylgeranyl pyrophosphate synthase [Hondaea fermentalgiana]